VTEGDDLVEIVVQVCGRVMGADQVQASVGDGLLYFRGGVLVVAGGFYVFVAQDAELF
jgi:hypothetical protein